MLYCSIFISKGSVTENHALLNNYPCKMSSITERLYMISNEAKILSIDETQNELHELQNCIFTVFLKHKYQ